MALHVRRRVAARHQRAERADDEVVHDVADDEDHERAAQAAAMAPATAALPRATAMLTSSERPSVARCRWSSRNGVTALPVTPRRPRALEPLGEDALVLGGVELLGRRRSGWRPRARSATPSASAAAIAAATSSAASTRQSRSKPPSVR